MKPSQTSSVHLSIFLGTTSLGISIIKKQTDLLNSYYFICLNFTKFWGYSTPKIFYKIDSGLSLSLPRYFVRLDIRVLKKSLHIITSENHQKIIRISPFKPSQATQRPYNFIHLPWKQLAVVNFISHEECNFCFRVMKCLAGAWSGAERSGEPLKPPFKRNRWWAG